MNHFRRLIPAKLAGNLLLIAFAALVLFHLLVLFKVVPPEIVWGGQISAAGTSLLVLEITALAVTLVFAEIIAAKIGYIRAGKFRTVVNIGVWIVFAYLILNLAGNLASGVAFENLVFVPITLVLALLALRLAVER